MQDHDEVLGATLDENERLRAVIKKLEARLTEYVASAPLCEEHKPDGGARSGCLVCGLIRLSHVLSRIDYACGEPNEYEVSGFDVHCNEEAVVRLVQEKMRRLAEAERLLRRFNDHPRHAENGAYLIRCWYEDFEAIAAFLRPADSAPGEKRC